MHGGSDLCLVPLFAFLRTAPIVDLDYCQLALLSTLGFGRRVKLVIFELVELYFAIVFERRVFLVFRN